MDQPERAPWLTVGGVGFWLSRETDFLWDGGVALLIVWRSRVIVWLGAGRGWAVADFGLFGRPTKGLTAIG